MTSQSCVTNKKELNSVSQIFNFFFSVEQIGKSYQSSLADVVQQKRKLLFEFHFSHYLFHPMLSSDTVCGLY